MGKGDREKTLKLSKDEQKAVEKMARADITNSVDMTSKELEALIELLGRTDGIIINASDKKVTVVK